MADFVFEGLPNIYGHPEHYEGGDITQKFKGNHFQNIKSRYLATMKTQLAAQQVPDSAEQHYIENLGIAQFQNLEAGIEQRMVEAYNNNIVPGLSGYMTAAKALDTGLKNADKKAVISALNQIIHIYKTANPQLMALIDETNENELAVIPAELDELLGVSLIMKTIDNIVSGNQAYNSQTVSSILTPSSEATSLLSDAVDAMAEGQIDGEILKMIKSGMLGTTSENLVGPGGKQVKGKATDIQLQHVQMVEEVIGEDGQVTVRHTFQVDPYATVKTYRSKSNISKMISYAGENSIAMSLLHEIYGEGPEVDYQLYNTIAFHGKKGIPGDLKNNYDIIRSDMVAQAAEKYIIGYTQTTASQLMIHNFRAYPILTILSAIAEQASQKTNNGGTYGGRGSIFRIDFDDAYKLDKVTNWIVVGGDASIQSTEAKIQRIKDTKSKIDAISTRGFLNLKAFNDFVKTMPASDSISLKRIVPRTKPTGT